MNSEQKTVQTLRALVIDMVQRADSGHPGAAMSLAPVTYALWRHAFTFSPDDPWWPNRDRFVLSAGHASALLYAMLHLTRVRNPGREKDGDYQAAVSISDLKSFRQLHSPCPGHPEFGETPGIETTTGPLGQGLATSVGMAIAEKWLENRYNTANYTIIDYHIYALCGDGCMMEGISHEAAALAGHLKLSNLCWIYDSNRITIEGSTDLTMTENIHRRFLSYGWAVMTVEDANDLNSLARAFNDLKSIQNRPVLLVVKSEIAYGSPNKQGSESAHGSPLGVDEVRLTKQFYNWPLDPPFLVPEEVYEHLDILFGQPGNAAAAAWNEIFEYYADEHPDRAAELKHIFEGTIPPEWAASLPDFSNATGSIATRSASGQVLNALSQQIPWCIGGSADLGPSTNTLIKDQDNFCAENYSGRNLRFGVREAAMAAIGNGMANAGLRPYTATFLVFSDYARPAIRLSALMQLPVLYIFTHDSISVGEDGPTHQPVEHLAALRAIPGLTVIRPADAAEVTESYKVVLAENIGPAALILSRQKLPIIDRKRFSAASGLHRGAYIIADTSGTGQPDVILIATGSEVRLIIDAYCSLAGNNLKIRLVSMPSWELFERQPASYRNRILPPDITRRIIVEQGIAMGWERYAGNRGIILSINSFGKSAPGPVLEDYFGFTVTHIIDAVKTIMQ